jgi:aryl-alcohol dehydrogenase-like predicted oxidoreductase
MTGAGRLMASASVQLKSVSPLGFGGYRLCAGVEEHFKALGHAITEGCTLVDTASNYCDGRSEELIGQVLSRLPQFPVFVITKCGYISPATEKLLLARGLQAGEFGSLTPESKYSLAPDVIGAMIAISLQRLRRSFVDGVLLHNPEHYWECASSPSREGYDATIRKAFEYLEGAVARGTVRYYGISSEALPALWGKEPDKWLEIAQSVSASHHFRLAEFPFNFAEKEALTKKQDGVSLIEKLRLSGIVSIGNRPLNGREGNSVLRFATYEMDSSEEAVESAYERSVSSIQEGLRLTHEPYDAMDFAIMKFLRDNRAGIEHPDLVDEIFARHFYPFVNSVWSEEIPAAISQVFRDLHEALRRCARQKLSEKARELRMRLIDDGLVAQSDRRSLAVLACEFGLSRGLDHVLAGMRNTRYVNELSHLFVSARRAHSQAAGQAKRSGYASAV